MTELATGGFAPSIPSDAIANGSVVPYYLDDRKLRDSIAPVDDRLYAFDDLLRDRRAVPAVRGPARGNDGHVPVSRLPVRHRDRRRDPGPATQALTVYEVQEVDGSIQVRDMTCAE